jgi:spore coat polysaccharide biosynthesis protein SpsF
MKAGGYDVREYSAEDGEVSAIRNCNDELRPDVWLFDVRTDLTGADLDSLRANGAKIAVLDDGSDRRLTADIAIYPPVPQLAEMDWSGFAGDCFAGWEWVVLASAPQSTDVRTQIPLAGPLKLLVSAGGSDPKRLTIPIAEAIADLELDTEVSFVIGPGFENADEIAGELSAMDDDFHVIDRPSTLTEAMSGQHLAIATFGVTAHELAASGVPAIYICHDKDQIQSADALAETGAGVNLGLPDVVEGGQLAYLVSAMADDRRRLRHMSACGRDALDGRGAYRVAEAILLMCRPAAAD